jgi:hypothetical protein
MSLVLARKNFIEQKLIVDDDNNLQNGHNGERSSDRDE